MPRADLLSPAQSIKMRRTREQLLHRLMLHRLRSILCSWALPLVTSAAQKPQALFKSWLHVSSRSSSHSWSFMVSIKIYCNTCCSCRGDRGLIVFRGLVVCVRSLDEFPRIAAFVPCMVHSLSEALRSRTQAPLKCPTSSVLRLAPYSHDTSHLLACSSGDSNRSCSDWHRRNNVYE